MEVEVVLVVVQVEALEVGLVVELEGVQVVASEVEVVLAGVQVEALEAGLVVV